MRFAAVLLLALAGCGAGTASSPPAAIAGTWLVEDLQPVLGELPAWTEDLVQLVVDERGIAFVAPTWRTSSAGEVLATVYGGAGELTGFVREVGAGAAAVRWSWRSTFPEFAEQVALDVVVDESKGGAAAVRVQVSNTSAGAWIASACLFLAR